MKAEKLMTEKKFIAKFKKAGFQLYKTKEIEKIYRVVHANTHTVQDEKGEMIYFNKNGEIIL